MERTNSELWNYPRNKKSIQNVCRKEMSYLVVVVLTFPSLYIVGSAQRVLIVLAEREMLAAKRGVCCGCGGDGRVRGDARRGGRVRGREQDRHVHLGADRYGPVRERQIEMLERGNCRDRQVFR